MHAILFEAPGQPLRLAELPIPQPGAGQVLLKVHACGVCHTNLHLVDGELSELHCQAAHIVAQIAKHEGKKVYAFTRPGDTAAQEFALRRARG